MKIPSALNILMCIMDVIFNYLFIYILDMGVAGAAIGTGLSMLITATMMLYFLLVQSDMLGIFKRREERGERREKRLWVGEQSPGIRGEILWAFLSFIRNFG